MCWRGAALVEYFRKQANRLFGFRLRRLLLLWCFKAGACSVQICFCLLTFRRDVLF